MTNRFALGAATVLAGLAATIPATAQTTISNPAGRTVKIYFTANSFVAPYETTASVFQSFNSDSVGTTYGDGVVTANNSQAPLPGQFGNYLAISKANNSPNTPDGQATFAVNDARLFSFALGSIHTSNSVTLKFQDNTTLQLDGLALIGNLAGQNASGLVTYDFGAALNNALTSITFRAGLPGVGNAFQIDQLAAAAPEPATWAMMIFGFGAAGAALRRRQRVRVRYA